MGKTLAELALTGIAALGIFGNSYVRAQSATPAPAELQAPKAPEQAAQKYPLPSDADLKKAEADIREVYSAEYKLTEPTKKQEFANKLLAQAGQIKNGSDLPTKCVLLRESYLMSSQQAKTLDNAFKAADALAKSYEGIDSIELKSTALETARKASKTQEDLESLANKYVTVIDESINDNKYDPATAMAKQLKTVAQTLKNQDLAQKATDYEKKIPLLKTEYTTAAKALETLTKNPADPAANLTYGKFLCGKGDWEKAIDYFAKGSDTDLKDAATQEMTVKTFSSGNPDTYVKLGEAWEKVAKKANKVDSERFNGRAVEWYQNALSEMTNPIAKAKLEKKLKEFEGKVGAQNGLVNLLALIDPQKDAVVGEWKWSGKELVSPNASFARLTIPYIPSDEYDIQLSVYGKPGGNDFIVGFAKKDKQFEVCFDAHQGKFTGIELIDGKKAYENDTLYKNKIFVDNNPKNIVCSIRNTKVTISVDGKQIIAWTPDYNRVSPSKKLPETNTLYLGSHEASYGISRLQIIPVSGQGKKLR